jgi:hypothetical protein
MYILKSFFLYFIFLSPVFSFIGKDILDSETKNNACDDVFVNRNVIIDQMIISWIDSTFNPLRPDGFVKVELQGHINFKNNKPIFIKEFAIIEENSFEDENALKCIKQIKIIPILHDKLIKKHNQNFKIETDKVIFSIKLKHLLSANCEGLKTVTFICQDKVQEINFANRK